MKIVIQLLFDYFISFPPSPISETENEAEYIEVYPNKWTNFNCAIVSHRIHLILLI